MKWYRKLYLGENAKKSRYKVFGLIRKNRFTHDTFLITVSTNPDNILDIISANFFLQPHFKNKKFQNEIYVIGLAKGKDEAYELVRLIVDETYKATGKVNVSEYLRFGQNINSK